jgi:ubiquinone/menaquinone biosynthesis C-methylase UbiE
VKRYIVSQFGHPRGLVGRLIGWAMAVKNRERNDWTLEALDIRPADRLLEIGFGPGITLAAAAELASSGLVAGIDRSALMVSQASRRNARAVREGRVRITLGDSRRLPFPDSSFEKAYASNVTMFWDNAQAHLAEMRRVLRPGGLLVLSLQPRWARSEDEVRAIGDDLQQEVERAGFREARLEFKHMSPVTALRVCAYQ